MFDRKYVFHRYLRHFYVCVQCLLFLSILGCGGDKTELGLDEPVSVVPAPQQLTVHEGRFAVKPDTPIIVYPGTPEMMAVGKQLADYISALPGYDLSVSAGSSAVPERGAFFLTTDGAPRTLGDEGYTLSVNENAVMLRAVNADGLYYGFQTLCQLLPSALEGDVSGVGGRVSIPCVDIGDVPRFSWRGMHLDVSRHFFGVDDIKRYIDILAMHKMNVFHWHLTDSQGWRIEIKSWPKLTEVAAWRADSALRAEIGGTAEDGSRYGGFYTQDEVREIVAYAAERHITVLPEIEMPGHSRAPLAAYPEFLCEGLEESMGGRNPGVFCAGREETFAFFEDVLTEVIELFPSEYIHVGADEVSKRAWKGCPLCQARMKAEGLADEDELQSYFVRRMEQFIVSKGRRLIGWDEILEGGLAPEATVMSWRGMKGGIKAARMEHDVIMTPEDETYFNHYQGDPDLEPAAWGGFTPLSMVYGFDPVPDSLTTEEARFVIGGQGCLWTEYLKDMDSVEYMVLPRISALAEVLWTPEKARDWKGFKRRMNIQYRRFDAMGINYARSPWNVAYEIDLDPETFNARVSMENDVAGAEIHYTLDGSEPTISSEEYTGTFTLDTSATFRAGSFVDGKQVGKTTTTRYIKHKAAGKKPVLAHQPSPRYIGSGEMTLTNCLPGSKNYADGQWQGFIGHEFVAVIDLGEAATLSRMASTYNHTPGQGIFMPKSVEYAVSDNGKDFTVVAEAVNDTPMDTEGPYIKEIAASFDPVEARYVRVSVKSRDGGGTWVFVDELVVQ